MPTSNYIHPFQISPHRIYQQATYERFLEGGYNPALVDYLYSFSHSLIGRSTGRISTFITPQTKQWNNKNLPETLQVYTFGNFRSHYRAIVRAADILAEFFEMTSILPLIEPLTNAEWRYQVNHDEAVFRKLRNYGVVLFNQG